MAKKKGRQADPGSQGEDDSTESCEENSQASPSKSCPHILKSADMSGMRRSILAQEGVCLVCVHCIKAKVEQEANTSVWVCLKCGYQSCGPVDKPSTSSHACKHHATPRSDSHALVVNSDDWNVWCFECKSDVPVNTKKKLHECVEYLKRQNKISPPETVVARPDRLETQRSGSVEASADDLSSPLTEKETPKKGGSKTVTLAAAPPSCNNQLPRVKGLTNLGNTCFFNAVLQCLAQTPFLVPLLKETKEEGERFHLDGCPDGTKDEAPVPELDGELGKWGTLTEALAETLADMQEPGLNVVTPRRLLTQLSLRAPHLSQGDQQDSHELLRHLMEGVRSEELRRFQDKILLAVGLTRKTDPSTVEEPTRGKARVYNRQASQLLLRPDQLFLGRLISTLQCQECLRQSHTPESFLDLSLPIASDRPQPPLVRAARRDAESAEPSTPDAPSKHQLKKERRQVHKTRRRQRGLQRNSENGGDAQGDGNSEGSKQSDADVEDNEDQEGLTDVPQLPAEVDVTSETIPILGPIVIDPSGIAHCPLDGDKKPKVQPVEDRGGGESGYATNGGTHSNSPGSPTSATEEVVACDPNSAHASALCSELASLALDETTPAVAANGLAEVKHVKIEPQEHKTSSEEVINKEKETVNVVAATPADDHKEDIKKDTQEKEEREELGEEEEEEREEEKEPEEEEEEEVDTSMWSMTLAPRPPASDVEGDCSIQSCLNQFAALELLTGNNRVSCKTCTQRAGGSASKAVCTNSTKQMLVSAPPAVLTLHLKRFELCGARFRKVSRHVSFPLLLDLAPICSTKCRDLPSVGEDQTQLLYSLYGVVEHSGALGGGHYVAYVKSRAQLTKNDPRWSFLLSNWTAPESAKDAVESEEKQEEEKEEEVAGAEGGLPEPPPGKWFYISDSRANEVSEKKVLQSQAYLLFYERIL